jgi:hypothetical protein
VCLALLLAFEIAAFRPSEFAGRWGALLAFGAMPAEEARLHGSSLAFDRRLGPFLEGVSAATRPSATVAMPFVSVDGDPTTYVAAYVLAPRRIVDYSRLGEADVGAARRDELLPADRSNRFPRAAAFFAAHDAFRDGALLLAFSRSPRWAAERGFRPILAGLSAPRGGVSSSPDRDRDRDLPDGRRSARARDHCRWRRGWRPSCSPAVRAIRPRRPRRSESGAWPRSSSPRPPRRPSSSRSRRSPSRCGRTISSPSGV